MNTHQQLPDPFDSLLSTEESRLMLKQEELLLRVASLASERMRQMEMSRVDLAKRMGITKGNVSQILRGDRNLSLRKLSDLFAALGASVAVLAAPFDANTFEIEDAKLVMPQSSAHEIDATVPDAIRVVAATKADEAGDSRLVFVDPEPVVSDVTTNLSNDSRFRHESGRMVPAA